MAVNDAVMPETVMEKEDEFPLGQVEFELLQVGR